MPRHRGRIVNHFSKKIWSSSLGLLVRLPPQITVTPLSVGNGRVHPDNFRFWTYSRPFLAICPGKLHTAVASFQDPSIDQPAGQACPPHPIEGAMIELVRTDYNKKSDQP